MLAEVTGMLNVLGPSSVSLAELAERLGLSRNALYHYCRDVPDLVFRCFEKTAEHLKEALACDAVAAGGPCERLTRFVMRTLGPEARPWAALSDVDWLPEPLRARARALEAEATACLADLIRDGMRRGDFRPCDPDLSARGVISVISWLMVSGTWLGDRVAPGERKRLALATADFLLNGLAAPNCGQDFPAPPDVNTLFGRTQNPFDPKDAASAKVAFLLAEASRLFNRCGVDGVRLDDIAAEIGATKGALYHHFKDKTDLVARSYERAFDIFERIMAVGVERGENGLSRARLVIHFNLQAQAGSLSPFSPQPGLPRVAEPLRSRLQARAQALRQIAAENLRQGAVDGSCRPHDSVVLAEASAGLFLWLPRWRSASPTVDPATIADALTELALFGLRAR